MTKEMRSENLDLETDCHTCVEQIFDNVNATSNINYDNIFRRLLIMISTFFILIGLQMVYITIKECINDRALRDTLYLLIDNASSNLDKNKMYNI